MATTPEAFLLLTLENTTLRTARSIQTGILALECVTVPVHDQRDVYLVLRLNDVEIAIEHDRRITLNTSSHNARIYTLEPTDSDSSTVVLDVQTSWHPTLLEDIETFDGILSQYTHFIHHTDEPPVPAYVSQVTDKSKSMGDYKGHLVLVNEDSGEIVGEFDKKINVHEDPTLRKPGHERDPVIIEVPAGKGGLDDDEHPLEFFARAIPPEERDWMTTSATVVSHAITHGTSLFISVLNGASKLYINRSQPSPHNPDHPSNADAAGPPKPPPRALVFLNSDKTRQNLTTAHTYTGKAVKISGQTVNAIHGMIKKTMGSDKKGKSRATTLPASAYAPSPHSPYQPVQDKHGYPSTPPNLPPNKPISRSSSPTPSYTMPPPGGAPPPYFSSSSGHLTPDSKPPLPPRQSPSSSRAPSPSLQPPMLPPRKLSTTKRVLLSADLILSTLDVSAKRVLQAGTSSVGAVVGHKYGEKAGNNAEMMMGTTRNLALVYVDVKGFGRKAILKTAGKEFVKGRFSSGK